MLSSLITGIPPQTTNRLAPTTLQSQTISEQRVTTQITRPSQSALTWKTLPSISQLITIANQNVLTAWEAKAEDSAEKSKKSTTNMMANSTTDVGTKAEVGRSEIRQVPTKTRHIDGGFKAWLQALASFCIFFNTW